MFEPSEQQKKVFDFVANDQRSLIVEARAGSGKTTTLVELAKLIPSNRLSLFLAFNKNIATELQQRLPLHIQAKTFHSHCFGALQRNLPARPKVDESKTFKICKDLWDRRDFDLYYKYVSRLVGYAKNSGIGCQLAAGEQREVTNPSEWYLLVDHYNLVLDSQDADEEEAVHFAMDVLSASNENVTTIDFDDMLYLALLRNVNFDKNNYIMLDEAQDTNSVQRALLHRMLAQDGRLIAVGDPAQSIYGFRGADADAMNALEREFNCVTLPLSVSYRCAQEPVLEAQKYVPEIQAHPTAPIGSVEQLPDYTLENFNQTDAILCRVTAPLVSLAFGFIKRNVGVRILGREIGAGLVALVKKMNTQDLDTLENKLRVWRDREMSKAFARGHDAAAAAIEDKVGCLSVFIDQIPESDRTVSELTRRIESLFSDNNKGLLTLCSVHKAKGLEWSRVFILDFDKYMPSRWAKQEWQHKQEINLIYVAITRAKLDLRYIQSDKWKVPQPTVAVSHVEQRRKELLESL